MTIFDTTGMGGHHEAASSEWGTEVLPAHASDGNGDGFDSLSLLRQAVADQIEIESITIGVPGTGVRLVCHTDITARQQSKWQQLALPPHLRGSAKATMLDVDQFRVAVAVLVHTLLRIEVRDPRAPGEWLVVEDSRDGRPLTFSDRKVLDMFGAIETSVAIKKLFGGREADAMKASRRIMDAAGYGEDQLVDPDAEDAELRPT